MPVIDDRGRLFGAINLIDLGALLFVAVLLPLTYGAYVLFRTPPPQITAVAPSILPYSKGVEQRLQVKGAHIRPFLRAKIGTLDTNGFAVITPQSAEIRFMDAPAGTYDVVLFDESQEVARLPNALTIAPPPVRVMGWIEQASTQSGGFEPGLTLGDASQPIQVVSVDPPDANGKRRAVLRVTCALSSVQQCLVAGEPAVAGKTLTLSGKGAPAPTVFHVDELRVDATWLTVQVRLMGLPDSFDQIRPGDIDIHPDSSGANTNSPVANVTTGAIVRALGVRQKSQGSYTVTAVRPQVGAADLTGYGILNAAIPVDALDASLLIPTDSNLVYRGLAIRPGNILAFETATYRLQGLVLSVTP